jgi:hypothetical protein
MVLFLECFSHSLYCFLFLQLLLLLCFMPLLNLLVVFFYTLVSRVNQTFNPLDCARAKMRTEKEIIERLEKLRKERLTEGPYIEKDNIAWHARAQLNCSWHYFISPMVRNQLELFYGSNRSKSSMRKTGFSP